MLKRDPFLEWDVLLDDTEWQRAESLTDLLITRPHRPILLQGHRRSFLWIVAGTVVLVALITASCLWMAEQLVAQAGFDQVEQELRDTVDTEEWDRHAENRMPADALVDDQADPRWREGHRRALAHSMDIDHTHGQAEIGDIVLRSGLAMVRVNVTQQDGMLLRQTRFYRQDGTEGWLRTSPSPVFWGPDRTVETTHFRIHYRQRDAQSVEGAASRLDAIYADLYSDLGIPYGQDKLKVEVKPIMPYQLGRLLEFEDGRLTVPSPLLLQIPAGLSDEEILIKSIVNPLVVDMLLKAQTLSPVKPEWETMVTGLRLWQAYAGSDSLAPWYRETVAWLYGQSPETEIEPQAARPIDLGWLCREYVIWRYTLPTDRVHPWFCADSSWRLSLPSASAVPVRLDALADSGQWSHGQGAPAIRWVQGVGAATVIDYVVAVYGRRRLSAFVAGFRIYDTWDALAPAVLEISEEKFEAGWLAYLLEQTERAGT